MASHLMKFGKTEDFIDLFKSFDSNNTIGNSLKQLKTDHFRAAIASFFMKEYVPQLRIMKNTFSTTPRFANCYEVVRQTELKYRKKGVVLSIDDGIEMINQTGYGDTLKELKTLHENVTSNEESQCADDELTEAEKKEEEEIAKQCISEEEKELMEYDNLSPTEISNLDPELRTRVLEFQKKKTENLIEAYNAFNTHLKFFYKVFGHEQVKKMIRDADPLLFTDEKYSSLIQTISAPSFWSSTSDMWYPENLKEAYEFLVEFDTTDDKRKIKKFWVELNNLLSIAEVQHLITDETFQKVLDYIRNTYDNFLNGKLGDIKEIPAKMFSDIKLLIPEFESLGLKLKDIILEVLFHNVNKLKTHIELFKQIAPTFLPVIQNCGINIELDKIDQMANERLELLLNHRNQTKSNNTDEVKEQTTTSQTQQQQQQASSLLNLVNNDTMQMMMQQMQNDPQMMQNMLSMMQKMQSNQK